MEKTLVVNPLAVAVIGLFANVEQLQGVGKARIDGLEALFASNDEPFPFYLAE